MLYFLLRWNYVENEWREIYMRLNVRVCWGFIWILNTPLIWKSHIFSVLTGIAVVNWMIKLWIDYIHISYWVFFFGGGGILVIRTVFSSPESKAQVSYCHSASSVRPSSSSSVVRRKLSHFRLLLQNRLMDFDETWYVWSTHGPLQVLLFFGQIRPGVEPERGQNKSRGSPSSRNFFFRSEGYRDKPNA